VPNLTHSLGVATKGRLGQPVQLASLGLVPDIDQNLPIPNWCDYPIAVNLATMGRLGSAMAQATRGKAFRICITEVPVKPRGGSSFPKFKQADLPYKIIKIEVMAYGEVHSETFIVEKEADIKVKDVEVVDKGPKNIEIRLKSYPVIK